MKRKTLIIVLMLFLITIATALLCGCDRFVVIEGIRMKDAETVETTVGEFSYEGKKVIVLLKGGEQREIDLTEDMIPEAERLKFYKIGEQDVKVVYNDRYATTLKINVLRRTFEDIYELVGYTCTYDGKPHRVELNHDLPEGARIDFKYGNVFTNAGTYEVVGVISKEGYVSKTVSAQLIIEKATFDLSEITFGDATAVYDGSIKTIEVLNLPEGISVSYSVYDGDIRINNAVNAGEYKIVARFEVNDGNYEKIRDRQATLTINKADYDMSKVKFPDVQKSYDGIEHTPSVTADSVLPQGVAVSYGVYRDGEKVFSNANAGVYEMVASFKGNALNYNAIPDMRATLTVEKRVINIDDSITFEDQTVNFDRKVHSLAISGELPSTVKVEYENNDKIYAGDYEVIARFSAVSDNDTVDVEEKHAFLIINVVREAVQIDGHEVADVDLMYNRETLRMVLIGLDTEVYGVRSLDFYDMEGDGEESKIEWGNPDFALVNGKTYRYSIKFYFKDENVDNSVRLSTSSGIYTNNELTFEDKTVAYTGGSQTIVAENVPRGIEVTYKTYKDGEEVEQAVERGVYTVVAHFTHNGEDIGLLSDREATLTII